MDQSAIAEVKAAYDYVSARLGTCCTRTKPDAADAAKAKAATAK